MHRFDGVGFCFSRKYLGKFGDLISFSKLLSFPNSADLPFPLWPSFPVFPPSPMNENSPQLRYPQGWGGELLGRWWEEKKTNTKMFRTWETR